MIFNIKTQAEEAISSMLKIIKVLIYIGLFGFAGLIGYSFFGDMSPAQSETRLPV